MHPLNIQRAADAARRKRQPLIARGRYAADAASAGKEFWRSIPDCRCGAARR
jgi:hypothetical protein